MAESRIIVALDGVDVDSWEKATAMAKELRDHIWGVKVGDVLLDGGLALVRSLKHYTHVMVDLKSHDIPFTAANHLKRVARAGADIATVHASGGLKMLEEAKKAAPSVQLAAVTALTSMSEGECQAIYGKDRLSLVIYLAHVVREAGIEHVVCSVKELSMMVQIRKDYAYPFKMIVPGYRPGGTVKGEDQVHVATQPSQVREASYVVIGRPILQALSPLEAAKALNVALESS